MRTRSSAIAMIADRTACSCTYGRLKSSLLRDFSF